MNKSKIALGLDIGARRIGVARGDLEVRLASPLTAIFNDETVMDEIAKIIFDTKSSLIVIGLPRDNNGQETEQSKFCRDFAHDLKMILENRDFDVEIILQDESLTSVIAEDNLRSRKNFDEKMLRDGTLDSEAAVIILQDYLENSKRSENDFAKN